MRPLNNALRLLALSAAISSWCVATPMLAQHISTDYDHSARFEQYHAYSFGNIHASNPFFEQRIKDEINKDLGARGWHMVPSGGDVTIVAVGGMTDQKEYTTFYDRLGGGWGWRRGWGGGGFGDTMTTVSDIPIGTLVVDLYETGQHRLLFRGTASDQLSTKSEKNTEKLDKAIDKIFDKFPPKGAM
jgi:hypothetical protein